MALSAEQIDTLLQELRDLYDTKEVQLIADNRLFSEIHNDLHNNSCIKIANFRAFRNWDYIPWLKKCGQQLGFVVKVDNDNQIILLCQN